jgi:hypothetical protein
MMRSRSLSAAALALALGLQSAAAQQVGGGPNVPVASASGGSTYTAATNGGLSLSGSAFSLGDGAAVAYASGALTLGTAGSVVGKVVLDNATSGSITLAPPNGALGSVTATLPDNTGTIAELNLVQSWTAGQTFSQPTYFSTNVFVNNSGAALFLYSGSSYDTTISRQSAGVLQVGTTAANALGTLAAAGFIAGGTAGATKTCSTYPTVVGGIVTAC